MAGAGYKSWVDGDILTAADVNTYLMQQAVMVFADAAARTTAITAPSEGMVTYLNDTNTLQLYDGSGWVNVIGEPVSFTPSFTNLTLGNGTTDFTYTIIGKTMFVTGRLLFGTTTLVTGNIEVTLPASATSNVWAIGQLYIRDFGAGTYGGFSALTDGDTGISFSNMYVSGSTVLHQTVNATTPITWANNDQLAFSITADIS